MDDEADPTTARPEGGYFRRVAAIRHVRFGSLAALQNSTTPMAASGGKAVVRPPEKAAISGRLFRFQNRYWIYSTDPHNL